MYSMQTDHLHVSLERYEGTEQADSLRIKMPDPRNPGKRLLIFSHYLALGKADFSTIQSGYLVSPDPQATPSIFEVGEKTRIDETTYGVYICCVSPGILLPASQVSEEQLKDWYVWCEESIHSKTLRKKKFDEICATETLLFPGTDTLLKEMPAGEELDRLVAEAINWHDSTLPRFSSCRSDAMFAFERWIEIQKEKVQAIYQYQKETGEFVAPHIAEKDLGYDKPVPVFERGTEITPSLSLSYMAPFSFPYPSYVKAEGFHINPGGFYISGAPLLTKRKICHRFEASVLSPTTALAISRGISMLYLIQKKLEEEGF